MGRPEAPRHRQLRGDDVHGDDGRRPREPRALDRVQTDAPRADHDRAAARGELRRVEHGPDARDHAAGEEARAVEAEVGGHRHQLRLVHDHGLREARDPDARVERPAVRCVEAVLGHQGVGPLAEVGGARQAGDAPAARAEERHDHRGRPAAPRVTPGPTSSTSPAASWPATTGGGVELQPSQSPRTRCTSLWQIATAPIRTRTSPAFGRIEAHVLDDQRLPQLVADRSLHGVRP